MDIYSDVVIAVFTLHLLSARQVKEKRGPDHSQWKDKQFVLLHPAPLYKSKNTNRFDQRQRQERLWIIQGAEEPSMWVSSENWSCLYKDVITTCRVSIAEAPLLGWGRKSVFHSPTSGMCHCFAWIFLCLSYLGWGLMRNKGLLISVLKMQWNK